MTPYHILLIEDDTAVATSLRAGLEQEGYRVSWCKNGRSALRAAQTEQPHLLILDIRLPDMTGFDICRQLRQQAFKAPIVMLTARQDELDKVLGLEIGADDYLTKPFGLRELQARIRAQLRRAYGRLATSNNSHTLQKGDLHFNLDAATVQRGSHTLNLTPTEYRLLVYLARHSGQALSRQQLLRDVWDDPGEVESERTVNVHIRRLREKVELNPSKPSLILTVPGIGYRFVTDDYDAVT